MYWPFLIAYSERAHLGEAKLAVQRDRRVVRQGYPSQGNMNRRLNSQAVTKRAIQRGAHALAPAADAKRDTDLNGLPESLEIPVALGAGIAQNLIATPGHQKPVRSGRAELAEPVASLCHADRLCLEARDGVGRRVVEDADDRRKVFLGRFSDLHLGRSALPAAGSLLHGHTVAASPGESPRLSFPVQFGTQNDHMKSVRKPHWVSGGNTPAAVIG